MTAAPTPRPAKATPEVSAIMRHACACSRCSLHNLMRADVTPCCVEGARLQRELRARVRAER